jgi:hypothetical protein
MKEKERASGSICMYMYYETENCSGERKDEGSMVTDVVRHLKEALRGRIEGAKRRNGEDQRVHGNCPGTVSLRAGAVSTSTIRVAEWKGQL